jgi:hypothetical protein
MERADKFLYHQIHPLKLGTDIVAAVISLFFFWQHQLAIALALHIVPPIIASFLVIRLADLEPQRRSAFGRYVKRMMTRAIEAIRLAGDVVMVVGAWYHSFALMLVGLLIVVGAWLSGLVGRKVSLMSHDEERARTTSRLTGGSLVLIALVFGFMTIVVIAILLGALTVTIGVVLLVVPAALIARLVKTRRRPR